MFPLPSDATTTWKLAVILLNGLNPIFTRYRVEGRENVPAEGGAVVACNHPGGVDVILLGYASPRQVYFMAKRELFEIHPWFSGLIRAFGAFPIRRGTQDAGAIHHSVGLVRRGHVLGMFPEGTRNRGRGMKRAKSGAVRIAMMADAPIVPAAITGVPELHREWKNPLRRTPISVRFGKPLHVGTAADDPDEIQTQTDRIMYAIAEMLPPHLRGVYARETEPK